MDYQFFQEYWWLLISVLGALLVFMLFVQGGQSMILQMKENQREDMIYSIAHRWELTFTVLVTFGGAFFASFPLFYSTSFGGAYWIWMLILFGFVVQAVSFKYRLAEGNILGRKTYDIFLFTNGILAPVLLGGAVSTFFFGSDFTVEKTNLTDASAPVISQWGDWHGLEVLLDWRVVFVDYGKPSILHPLAYVVRMFNRLYQPFAEKLWDREIASYADKDLDFNWKKQKFLGRLYRQRCRNHFKSNGFHKSTPIHTQCIKRKRNKKTAHAYIRRQLIFRTKDRIFQFF